MRRRGLEGEMAILSALLDGPKTMRQLQKETGLEWNAIYYWLRNTSNTKNLVLRGCVVESRIVGETSNRAQDMYKYSLSEYGRTHCLKNRKKYI